MWEAVVMPAKTQGYKAWLVRWEWAGEHARVDEPIIAILSPHLGAEDVRKFVERYYTAATYTPSEKLTFMRHPEDNPYPAIFGTTTFIDTDSTKSQIPWQGLISCGHNPHIVASLVDNVREVAEVEYLQRLIWDERPRPDKDVRPK